MSGITTPYDMLIRAALPRVLSQLSRDPDAPTYGCFDRNHWHFKIRDFSSIVLQASALTLALLAREDDGLMPPEEHAALGEWARAACEYWASRQHRDGTFDEYYPNERAVIPTSFSTFAVSRIFTAGGPGKAAPSSAVMNALVRAAWALSRRSEHFALNQEAASLPAMLAVARLSGDERLQRAAEAKIERFLGLQRKEGWFDERGGIDVGYLSTTLDYLCEAHRLLPRADLLDAARRTADVLQYFCHTDGTCGGQYGSRNTEYLIPSGFEYLADEHPPSAAVCAWFDERVLGALGTRGADAASGANSFYAAFDDRYLCHNMLHAAVRAREYHLDRVRRGKTEAPLVPVPSLGAHDRHFGEAGLWVAGDWRVQTIVALKKGGVVHGVTADGRFWGDYGYRCLDAKGRLLVSSWQSERWRVERVENGYRTTGPLCRATFTRITPLRHIALRVLAKVLGPRLIPLLQKRLILHDAPSEATLARTVTRDGDRLRVEDRLESPAPLTEVRPAPKYSLRHVASSMYFRREEYALGGARRAPLPIERVGGAYVVRRTRVWDLTTGRELAGDG